MEATLLHDLFGGAVCNGLYCASYLRRYVELKAEELIGWVSNKFRFSERLALKVVVD